QHCQQSNQPSQGPQPTHNLYQIELAALGFIGGKIFFCHNGSNSWVKESSCGSPPPDVEMHQEAAAF
ncbi:hypothetical protein, partial [Pseudomonas aeruginosa]|uniref:hypothetical protein n=2 Tax=Pseudomonas aeruginosa TaxID=287 RepID=UPI0019D35F4A